MQVEEELAQVSPEKDMLLTVGVFDGVHLGHKHLLSQLKEQARQRNSLSGVLTFRRHPQEVLSPQIKLPYLTNLTHKVKLLRSEGVDRVIVLSFTKELAQLSARQFVELLKKYLRMRGLLIGSDFVLGRNREGNADVLRALGRELDFSVIVIPLLLVKGEVVSSTAIREALAQGDVKRVMALIGRSFRLQGRVTTGAGRGLGLGFPTANLEIDPKQALPAEGVYATWAHIDGQVYPAVTNIGRRPTFGGNGRTVETYVVNYRGDLYGRELEIDIVERLREERRFDTVEELKRQIAEDIKRGKVVLDSRGAS